MKDTYTYFVIYDLNPEKDYSALMQALISLSHLTPLKSGWIVMSDEYAYELCMRLEKLIYPDDRLAVAEVHSVWWAHIDTLSIDTFSPEEINTMKSMMPPNR